MAKAHRLSVSALVLVTLVAIALLARGHRTVASPSTNARDQKLWSAYWTTSHGFSSILELKNNRSKETVTVHPTLYSRAGDECPLPAITLSPRQTVTVDLDEAAESLHFATEGTLEVAFSAPNNHAVMGSVSVTNRDLGLAWNFRLYAADPLIPTAPVRGLFWFESRQTRGFVAIQNTSEDSVLVYPTFDVAGQRYPLPLRPVSPGQGFSLDLRKELAKLDLQDTHAGALELAYQGPGDALQAHEVLYDGSGFSAEVDFLSKIEVDSAHEFALRTPQFAMGEADARLGLPPKTIFEPTLVLHNFDSAALDTSIAIGWKNDQTPTEKEFSVSLAPDETRVVPLRKLLKGAVPGKTMWASMEIKYSSAQNALAGALVSKSEDGSHSIHSVLNWVEGSASDGPFWEADEDHNTLLGIFNTDTEPAQVSVSLSYYVGNQQHTYSLPRFSIAPRSSEQIDVGALVSSGRAGPEGEVMPPDVRIGGYRVRKVGPRIDQVLITEELVFNRRSKSYLTFYNTCCPLTNIHFLPASVLGVPGDTSQISITATDYCSGSPETVTDSGTFSSLNSAIAAVGANDGVNNGRVTIEAVGTTFVNGNINFFNFKHFTPPCVPASSGGQTTATGVTVTFSGPSYVVVGQTATLTAIVSSGNTSPISLSIDPAAAIVSPTGTFTTSTSVVVRGLTPGTATLTAKAPNPEGGSPITVGSTPLEVDDFQGVLTASDNFAGRSSTRYGIGEIVNLSASLSPSGFSAATIGGLQWSIVSGGGTLSGVTTNGTATYTAPSAAASVVLKLAIASGPFQGVSHSYNLTIVAPSGAYLVKFSGLRHTAGFLSVGFKGHIYLTPTDVSFANLKFAEGTVNAVATGYFASLNGAAHPASAVPLAVTSCNTNTGCLASDDAVDTNDGPPPFSAGDFLWAIPWQYKIGNGALTTFTAANHHSTADASGKGTIEKAGAGPFSKNASDPTSGF